MLPAIFEDSVWQMSWGERAAVEGVLSQLKPELAIEIGSMEGACLRRIAAHAQEVHSFDLMPPTLPQPENVTLHTGDSHDLLPRFLAEVAEQERTVDFAVVDGDHSAQGVRRDVEDLLDSRALARAAILIHDTANEEVRRGLDAVRFRAWPKVTHVDLDWIPGRLFAEAQLRNELWFGMGVVLVDSSHLAYGSGHVYEQRFHPGGTLLAQVRDLVLAREHLPASVDPLDAGGQPAGARISLLEAELGARLSAGARAAAAEAELELVGRRALARERELEELRQAHAAQLAELAELRPRFASAERALENIKGSASWRMTEPIRATKRLVRPRSR